MSEVNSFRRIDNVTSLKPVRESRSHINQAIMQDRNSKCNRCRIPQRQNHGREIKKQSNSVRDLRRDEKSLFVISIFNTHVNVRT